MEAAFNGLLKFFTQKTTNYILSKTQVSNLTQTGFY